MALSYALVRGVPIISESGSPLAAMHRPGGTVVAALAAKVLENQDRIVNVRDFGAAGNGIADDTAAIQAAIDEIETRTGGMLFLPEGDYRITASVNCSARLRMFGVGQRRISSVNPLKQCQGSRIVSDHAGDAIVVRGVAADPVKQRGGIINLQVYASKATYPLSRGIYITDQCQEFVLQDVLVQECNYGVYVEGGKALRLYECYLSDALTSGFRIKDATDCQLWHSQFAGKAYGAHFDNVQSLTGEGNRFQASGTANLFLDGCAIVNLSGGIIDSASISEVDNGRIGVWARDSHDIRINDTIYYSNGLRHIVCECSAAGTMTGAEFSGQFMPGDSGTSVAIHFINGGGTLSQISIQGDLRNMAVPCFTGNTPSTLGIYPSLGTNPTRYPNNSVPSFDNLRTFGTSSLRFLNFVAQNFLVFNTQSAANANYSLDSLGLRMGAGGNSALDVVFGRLAADVAGVAAGDHLKITDGGWNGGHFQMGAYHLWIDAAGRLRIKSSAPTSDTDGTIVGVQA